MNVRQLFLFCCVLFCLVSVAVASGGGKKQKKKKDKQSKPPMMGKAKTVTKVDVLRPKKDKEEVIQVGPPPFPVDSVKVVLVPESLTPKPSSSSSPSSPSAGRGGRRSHASLVGDLLTKVFRLAFEAGAFIRSGGIFGVGLHGAVDGQESWQWRDAAWILLDWTVIGILWTAAYTVWPTVTAPPLVMLPLPTHVPPQTLYASLHHPPPHPSTYGSPMHDPYARRRMSGADLVRHHRWSASMQQQLDLAVHAQPPPYPRMMVTSGSWSLMSACLVALAGLCTLYSQPFFYPGLLGIWWSGHSASSTPVIEPPPADKKSPSSTLVSEALLWQADEAAALAASPILYLGEKTFTFLTYLALLTLLAYLGLALSNNANVALFLETLAINGIFWEAMILVFVLRVLFAFLAFLELPEQHRHKHLSPDEHADHPVSPFSML